ncbi:hypothetical protein NMY3_01221 [Candidatus Nitrosocosmicus oleophilus]|uniref:Uncharacterized protein n=1 Tax=Candidatus Nitrosocosmicus oleophilus TaxID=1353260 RepID=A0A654LYC7_9ARCH|nr:hypothetical protein [Candidatus Nitrosocosmicus oleophilus]ALI35426.1 hypothetical protein NMY3_01221 [Candidatus Nitrosocosmicus oleophilus]
MQTTQKDKEDQILNLLEEGYTNRQICKIEHCSPNKVSSVNKKRTGKINELDTQIKNKSICSQVFDLLEKKVPLAQIITRVDIDPDEAMKIENKYLQVSKRDRIIYLLREEKDMVLTIEKLEFLKANPDLWKEIKKTMDIQTVNRNLVIEGDNIENEIEGKKILLKNFYNKMIKEKRKKLGIDIY